LTQFVVWSQRPELYFSKITTTNGLSHNKVNCIIQDKRGFIWFGTDDGLNRYDGNNFLIFRNKPGSAEGVSGNIINDIWEDESGILWIATGDGGLTRYDYRFPPGEQFRHFKNRPGDKSSIPLNIINALAQDRKGFIWLATSGKRVIRLNKQTEKFDEPVNVGTSTATALCLDNKDNLWVGRQGGGLLKVNTQTLQLEYDERYSNLYAKLPHVVVTSVFMDHERNIWYGSWDRVLYRFNTGSQQEEIFQRTATPNSFDNDQVDDMVEDDVHRVWMAGRYNGLHVFDKAMNCFYNYRFNPALEGTIADNKVNCVFIDRDKNLWVGTDKGVCVSKLNQQFTQQFLPGSLNGKTTVTIYDFFRDTHLTTWIAASNGIYVKRNGEDRFDHMPVHYKGEDVAVTKFYKDSDGTMYFGTDYSLFRYNEAGQDIELLPNTEKDKVMNRIIASRVVSIIRDTINDKPVLLVSPYGHYIAYYDLAEKKWVSRLDSSKNIVTSFNLLDNLVRKFYRSKDGTVRLATVKEGLGEWEKKPAPIVRYYKNDPANTSSLANNHVFDMTDDGNTGLWVTTYGGGLQHFNIAEKKFDHISSSANLVEGVQTDSNGNVWMVGGGNLHRYSPGNKSYTSYELPDIEKSGGVKGYIYKDQEGKLYVSGANYFISFHPESIRDNTGEPVVIFTDFKIFNNSFSHLLFQKHIRLKYNQNFFTIEFATPFYSGSEKIHYSYMLEGVDRDWVDAGTRNFASYQNAGSGNFTFKVRASIGNGKWTPSVFSIRVEIVPPFWRRWWFYVICVLVITGILYTIYRYRVNELVKRQAIRNKIAQDLHDNIGSTLSSISVYSEVARIHGEKNQKDDLNDLLEKISNTSTEMVAEMNDIVWAINPRNDSMDKVVQRMESFAKPLAAARNIVFTLEYDKAVLSLQISMDKRKNFYLVFKEAVNNAIKYSGASTLSAVVSIMSGQLVLEVKDNGIGFPVEKTITDPQAPGNGIRNMKTRTAQMNGTFDMNSQPGMGTTIRLSFPLG
jgi:ligand-binding sensor domain-containing protein/two-component sensor histidine kinase